MSSTSTAKKAKRPKYESHEIGQDDQSGELKLRENQPMNMNILSVESQQPETAASLRGYLTDGVEQESHPVILRAVEEYGSDLDAAMRSLCALSSMDGELTTDNPLKSYDDWASFLVSETEKAICGDDFTARFHTFMKRSREENTIEPLIKENSKVALQQSIEVLKKENKALIEELELLTLQKRQKTLKALDGVTEELEFLKQKVRSMEAENYELEMRVQQAEHEHGTHKIGK